MEEEKGDSDPEEEQGVRAINGHARHVCVLVVLRWPGFRTC